MAKLRHGQTFLYDDNDDIIGVRDIDGSEFLFARKPDLGVFFDTTTQTDGSGAVAMTFNTTAISRGITLVDGSKIKVSRSGLYNWHLSVHVHNDDSQAHLFEFWGKKNNVDIDNSRFIYSAPSSHGGASGAIIPSQNFFLQLNAGDEVQIVWAAEDPLVTIAYHAAVAGRPVSPSLMLTVNYLDD